MFYLTYILILKNYHTPGYPLPSPHPYNLLEKEPNYNSSYTPPSHVLRISGNSKTRDIQNYTQALFNDIPPQRAGVWGESNLFWMGRVSSVQLALLRRICPRNKRAHPTIPNIENPVIIPIVNAFFPSNSVRVS